MIIAHREYRNDVFSERSAREFPIPKRPDPRGLVETARNNRLDGYGTTVIRRETFDRRGKPWVRETLIWQGKLAQGRA